MNANRMTQVIMNVKDGDTRDFLESCARHRQQAIDFWESWIAEDEKERNYEKEKLSEPT